MAKKAVRLDSAAPTGVPNARVLLLVAAAAIIVRIASVSLRGRFLGFDESMYIILGRNLLSGRGYTLDGLPCATFPFAVPLLAGLFDMLGGPRLAVSLPSALLGGAAVIPLYFLAERIASRTVAVAAALIYIGFPALVYMSPFLSYAGRLYEGAEQIYLFFFLFAAYFAYAAADTGRWRDFLLAGAFAGAAFEVRQDALAWAAVILVWLVAAVVLGRRLAQLPRVLAFAAAALAAALPFLLYVRVTTGVYGTGPRFAKTFFMRDTFSPVMSSDDWREALDSYFALNDDGAQLETSYYGVSPWHRRRIIAGAERVSMAAALKDLRGANIAVAWRAFTGWVIPRPLGIVAIFGIVGLVLRPRFRLNATFLAATALPALFIAALLFPLMRFWVYLVPFVIILVAWGLVLAGEVVAGILPSFARWTAPLALVAAFAMSAAGAWHAIRVQQAYRAQGTNYERVMEGLYTSAAQWLFLNTAADARIMASSPQSEVLSDRQWLPFPHASVERTLRFARLKSADAAVETVANDDAASLPAEYIAAIFSGITTSGRLSVVVYDLSRDEAAGAAGPASGE